jgi:hypothetical protein
MLPVLVAVNRNQRVGTAERGPQGKTWALTTAGVNRKV